MTISKWEAARRRTAYHEAGHACAYSALGVDVGVAWIQQEPDLDEPVIGDKMICAGQTSYRMTDLYALSHELRALPSAAGPAAESLYSNGDLEEVNTNFSEASCWRDPGMRRSYVGDTDWLQVEACLSFRDGMDEKHYFLHSLIRAAARILRYHWTAVESIAQDLLRHGTVAGDDVRRTLARQTGFRFYPIEQRLADRNRTDPLWEILNLSLPTSEKIQLVRERFALDA